MTIDEAIKNREDCLQYLEGIGQKASPDCVEAVRWSVKALKALHPINREQVEKVWPECDCCEIPCNNCKSAYKWDTHGLADECVVCRKSEYKNYTPESQFCEFCGKPLTDEAVDILLKRLETLKDGNTTD